MASYRASASDPCPFPALFKHFFPSSMVLFHDVTLARLIDLLLMFNLLIHTIYFIPRHNPFLTRTVTDSPCCLLSPLHVKVNHLRQK